MIEIPFKDLPAFTEVISLDGDIYSFYFYWNTRGEYWSLTVLNNETPLVGEIKLVLDQDLFKYFPDKGLPGGKLFVIDSSNNYAPIERNDFINDRQLKLIYIEKNEIL